MGGFTGLLPRCAIAHSPGAAPRHQSRRGPSRRWWGSHRTGSPVPSEWKPQAERQPAATVVLRSGGTGQRPTESYGAAPVPLNRDRSGQGRDRTADTRIFNPVLYQLSYLSEFSSFRRNARPATVMAPTTGMNNPAGRCEDTRSGFSVNQSGTQCESRVCPCLVSSPQTRRSPRDSPVSQNWNNRPSREFRRRACTGRREQTHGA